jgi:hypothetical protein
MDQTNLVIEYAKTTKNICMITSISIFLILIFILSPLKNFFMTSIIGKISILSLLGYILYINISKTSMFSKQFGVDLVKGYWSPIKTNILCSYIFNIFIFILFFSVVRTFF